MLMALVSAQLEADKLCIYKSQGNIWRISSAAPGEGTITVPYPAQNKEIEFGIWEKVKCGDDEGYALMTDLGTGKCTLLTDDKNNPKVTPLGNEDLKLLFQNTNGPEWEFDAAQDYKFQMILEWNGDDEDFSIDTSVAPDSCTYAVKAKKKAGCPFIRGNAIWKFLDKYSVYVTPAVIIVGAFFLMVGGYFKKISIFLIVLTSVVFISIFALYAFILPYSTPEWAGWVIIICSVIAGLIAGFFLATFLKIGVFLLGAWGGAMLATTLYGLFVYKISDKSYVLYIMIAVFALIIALLSLKLLKLVLVIWTSFIGAYMVVRGAAVYIGGYTNEFQLINEIQAKDIDNIPWSAYVYILSIFALAILGILFQQYRFKLLSRKGRSGDYQNL